jgi:uncharacterized cupin superfamily protein
MHVTRFDEAPRYDAPGHLMMEMRRVQGREAGPTDTLWMGISIIEPGGGTTFAASLVEKFYVVLEGELQVAANDGGASSRATLRPLDTCRLAPGESRQLHNGTTAPCKVLLVMPNP